MPSYFHLSAHYCVMPYFAYSGANCLIYRVGILPTKSSYCLLREPLPPRPRAFIILPRGRYFNQTTLCLKISEIFLQMGRSTTLTIASTFILALAMATPLGFLHCPRMKPRAQWAPTTPLLRRRAFDGQLQRSDGLSTSATPTMTVSPTLRTPSGLLALLLASLLLLPSQRTLSPTSRTIPTTTTTMANDTAAERGALPRKSSPPGASGRTTIEVLQVWLPLEDTPARPELPSSSCTRLHSFRSASSPPTCER